MPALQRIAVVGTSGSGKTTLARQLSGRLGLAHVELDALHWDAGWAPTPAAIFQQRADAALGGDAWVVDGNYPEVRDLIWRRADTIVWLDYRLALIMWRLTLRTFRRVATREVLWNGNRERDLSAHFFSRDSIFLMGAAHLWAATPRIPGAAGIAGVRPPAHGAPALATRHEYLAGKPAGRAENQ